MKQTVQQEKVMSVESLSGGLRVYDQGEKVSYGFLCVLSGAKSFINSVYRDKNCQREQEEKAAESIMFDGSKVSIVSKDGPLDTRKYVYLVRYVCFEKNPNAVGWRKGRSVDRRYPVEVLQAFEREKCEWIAVENGALKVRYKYDEKQQSLTTDTIRKIEEALDQVVTAQGSTRGSAFTILMRQFGILNFREYAETVGAFLQAYLPAYVYHAKAVLDGKACVDVIVKADSPQNREILANINMPLPAEPVRERKEVICLEELDVLYEAGAWMSFLSSPVLRQIPPAQLPVKYFEMAVNCAEQLLYGEEAREIQLNEFQRQLFMASSAMDLVKGWKGTAKMEMMRELCAKTCLAAYPENLELAAVSKLINRVGYTNGHNSAYRGIRARFVACKNQLVPHVFLINAFTTPKDDIITEFCVMIKSWKSSIQKSHLDPDPLLYALHRFLAVYQKHILQGEAFENRHRSVVFSVFLDIGRLERLGDTLALIDPDPESIQQLLLDLMERGDTWTQERFAQLASQKVSKQLLVKCVAVLWSRHTDPIAVYEGLLRLLAWVIRDYGNLVLDEILQIHYSGDFTKLEKSLYLLNRLDDIRDATEREPVMYILGSYVYSALYPNIHQRKITEKHQAVTEQWASWAEEYYQEKAQALIQITRENEEQLLELMKLFCYDPSHYRLLQEKYADWFCASFCQDVPEEQITQTLSSLQEKGAHFAYIRAFDLWSAQHPQLMTQEASLYGYADALTAMEQYVELVAFANRSEDITDAQRIELLIRAMTENFRRNGLDPRAFAIFSDSFTEEDAIALLLKQMSPVRSGVVNSLIALYAYRKEYSKAHYLALIFRKRSEVGFRVLFTHFYTVAGNFSRYYQKEHNHFDAITLALRSLEPDALLDFLKMASQIKIPEYKDYDQNHVYAYLYNILLSEPMNQKPWAVLLQHSIKNIEHNVWNVVVCERVLRKKFGSVSSAVSGQCINKLLSESKVEDLPYNLLPYVCMYIMDTDDRRTLELLAKRFEQEEFVSAMVTDNFWYEGYATTWAQFTRYCLELYARTQDETVYSLIRLTGMTLSGDSIAKIRTSGHDKRYLFKQICDNYLNGMDLAEMTDLLNAKDWANLSASDAEMLKVLRIIYTDDEYFLVEHEELYPDEESVHRLKQDCARILREYPSKRQLFEFDGNCTNLAHKFLVYSVVFPVLYDEEIYTRCWHAWTADIQDERVWRAYYAYLETTFQLQLSVNAAYEMLYKRFRYLKLYINMVCQRGLEGDDSFIISAMEQHGHMEQIYNTFYVPMKREMAKFVQITGLSREAKRRFLECLVNGPMDLFLKHHDAELEGLPAEDKAVLRRMMSSMDWRCANESLYTYYWEQIRQGNSARALAAAEAFSIYAFDTLRALGDGQPDKLGGIDSYAFLVGEQGKRIKNLMSISKELFDRHETFLIPVVCSRTFHYRILAYMRYNVLKNMKFSDRYEKVLNYLTRSGCTDTAEAYHYLRALYACVHEDRQAAAQILRKHDLTGGIPALWNTEAERIRQYASGASAKFQSDKSITDVSMIGDDRRKRLTFVNRLAQKLEVQPGILEKEELNELYDQFRTTNKDPWQKMQLGLRLLLGYGRNRSKEQQEDGKLPKYSRLEIEVGMIAIAGDTNLSVDDKVAVAADLYEERELFRKLGLESSLMDLNERFHEMLRKRLTIATWSRHGICIEAFLKAMNDAQDFTEVFEKILKPCTAFMEPQCSLEERTKGLQKLLQTFRELPSPGSVYAKNVEYAIGTELRRLADGICLRVSIVNEEDTITDGRVYFQIENVGKRTASLKNDNITVLIRSNTDREHSVAITDIEDLRSGFVTGGCDRLRAPDKKNTRVTIRIVQQTSHGDQNLCSTSKTLKWGKCPDKLMVRRGNEYEVTRAISQERLLYGRDTDKEDLKWCVPRGVTVIYGPSRIGKTSLLNWVQNDLARKQGNVMTLLYGGEKAAYKFSDWNNKNYADASAAIPYDDDEKMSEYLLSDTIIHGLDKNTRFAAPNGVAVTQETLDKIRRIMQKKTYLIERYYELDEYLGHKGLELWLLLDEFQQIVQRWKITGGCDFHSVCNQIGEDIHNIKLVLCGSDELLKHMVLNRSSEWKTVLQRCKTHQVEPLDQKHFEQMIREEPSLAGTNIHYSESALRALFTYTDGVALYGKEICNALLRDIESVPDGYAGRNTIYISDIAKMTQRLLNVQADELSTKIKESISKIYKEVTKNLDTDTNNILWYIARWLNENPQEDGFNERVLYDQKLHISNQTLEESLTIARARGIIRSKSKAAEHQGIYVFRTLFYHFAFLGSAPRMQKLEEVLIADTAEEDDIITEKSRLDDMVENFKLVDNKRTALQTLYANMEPEEQQEYLKGVAHQHYGDNVEGNKNVAQNIQINSQTINNTFHTLLAGPQDAASFAKALAGMPTIGGYLSKENRETLKDLTERAFFEEDSNILQEIQENIRAITSPCEEEMLSDTLGAAVRTAGFLDVDENRWISLLGLSGTEEYGRLRELPAEFFAPLGFAVMLHNIFMRIEDNAPDAENLELDFCPVAIMYCKVVEGLLKKLHTPIYVHKIGRIATIKKGVYFETLLSKDGVTLSDTKDLSIGSFSVNIAKTPFSNHVDERRRFKVAPRTDTILKLVGAAGRDVHQQWCDHAWTLSVIRAIRNKSAHEAAPITRENFDWLIEEMFHKGGLLRIAELAQKTPV